MPGRVDETSRDSISGRTGTSRPIKIEGQHSLGGGLPIAPPKASLWARDKEIPCQAERTRTSGECITGRTRTSSPIGRAVPPDQRLRHRGVPEKRFARQNAKNRPPEHQGPVPCRKEIYRTYFSAVRTSRQLCTSGNNPIHRSSEFPPGTPGDRLWPA